MSATPESPPELTRYLLGQLTEQDASALEERFFSDDELFARVEVAADDLAARYLKGTLSADERVRFQKHLLGSRDDRLRLRVTRALGAYVATRGAPAMAQEPAPTRLWRFTGVSRFVTAAAGVALVAGVAVLSWRVAGLQSDVSSLRSALSEEQETGRVAAAAALERERGERTRREAAEQRLAELETASFAVSPGTERGSGSVLLVPAGAAFVRFDLALERALSGQCRVTVRTPARAVVWSRDISVAPGAASVSVVVAAGLLLPGQYEAVLESLGSGGTATEVSVYSILLSRKNP